MKNENDTSSEKSEEIVPDLKTIRESRGISLEDIFKSTRIPVSILEAIENENFRLLPEPVYARIFIKTFAGVVGIESEVILSRYDKYLEERKAACKKKGVKKRSWSESLKFLIWALTAICAAILIALLLYPTYKGKPEITGRQISEDSSKGVVGGTPYNESEPERNIKNEDARDIKGKTEAGGNTIETVLDRPATEGVVETEDRTDFKQKTGDTKTTYSLTIEATDSTWIKIAVDQNLPHEVLLKQGEKIYREASERFIIDIGNAGGVNVLFQGKSLGVLGKRGEVIRLTLPEDMALKRYHLP